MLTGKQSCGPVPQPLDADTQTLPPGLPVGQLTLMAVVFCPPVMLAPAGTVQT